MLRVWSLFCLLALLVGCDYWEMDECLEQGGIWNPRDGVCEYENSNTVSEDGDVEPE